MAEEKSYLGFLGVGEYGRVNIAVNDDPLFRGAVGVGVSGYDMSGGWGKSAMVEALSTRYNSSNTKIKALVGFC